MLSDLNERKWYDEHKDQILREDDTEYSGIDLWHFFNPSAYSGFDDSETGFYNVYNSAFDEILEEEKYKFLNRIESLIMK